MDSIEFAFDDAKHGEPAGEPGHGGADTEPAASRAGTGGAARAQRQRHVRARRSQGRLEQGPKAELQARLMQVLERHAPGIGTGTGQ
jgi:hypothetical protein